MWLTLASDWSDRISKNSISDKRLANHSNTNIWCSLWLSSMMTVSIGTIWISKRIYNHDVINKTIFNDKSTGHYQDWCSEHASIFCSVSSVSNISSAPFHVGKIYASCNQTCTLAANHHTSPNITIYHNICKVWAQITLTSYILWYQMSI